MPKSDSKSSTTPNLPFGSLSSDVTARISESRFKLALDAANMTAFERDHRTNFIRMSPGSRPLLTQPAGKSEWHRDETYDRIHAEDRDRVKTEVDRAIAEHRDYDLEFRVCEGDNQVRWLYLKGRAHYDALGCPIRSYGIAQDITSRRKIEQTAARSEHRLRMALEFAHMAVGEVKAGQVECEPAQQFAKLFNIESCDPHLAMSRLLESLHPEDRAAFQSVLLDGLSGSKRSLDFRVIQGEGVRWLHGQRFETSDAGEPLILNVVQDITWRKEAEAEFLTKTAELSLANAKLERFAAIAAHDLKGPLQTISFGVDLLLDNEGIRDNQDNKDQIDFIRKAAKRMSQLIDDLLIFARLGERESTGYSLVDLNSAWSAAVANLQSAIVDLKAVVRLHAPLPKVYGNELHLTRIFQNMISNSLKFRGSEIPQIELKHKDDGKHFLFSLKDNGMGIDPINKDEIFNEFQRGHKRPDVEGSGLGLAICKKIIESHGGRVWFESVPGVQTTFHFHLPKP